MGLDDGLKQKLEKIESNLRLQNSFCVSKNNFYSFRSKVVLSIDMPSQNRASRRLEVFGLCPGLELMRSLRSFSCQGCEIMYPSSLKLIAIWDHMEKDADTHRAVLRQATSALEKAGLSACT